MFGLGVLVSLFGEIEKAARQEMEVEQQQIMVQLRSLHHALESGEIDDDAFDRREDELLNRLEQIKSTLE